MHELTEFRHMIHDLKAAILNKIVYTSQDPRVLNTVTDELKREFVKLRTVIRESNISSDTKRLMMYHLRRDFLMFPFTLDEKRIDEFPKENSMEEIEYGPA